MSYCNGCNFWNTSLEHCADPHDWVNDDNQTCCRHQASARMIGDTGTLELLACPFCGKAADLDDPDTLYPTGTYWYPDGDYGQTYSTQKFNHIGVAGTPCYKIVCDIVSGGCGAEMHGDSKQETVDKWNSRA